MALSACCVTADPSRAAAVLAGLRDAVEEIVVAVDVSGGEQELTPLAALADRLFEVELDTFPEPAMAWLHERCSGEWVLRVDDDEVVDVGLLERLPELTRARDVSQYWIARRWLYPDTAHRLDEWPWFPDFQGRLVRNDARLWFPGLCHSGVAPTLPLRYLESGLHHLVLLLSDLERRERKVEAYRAVDPRLRVTSADPHLSTYYLPERHPGARLAAVDPRERAAIEAALGRMERPSPREPPRAGAEPARRVGPAEMLARWAGRELDEGGYRASIEPVDLHRRMLAGDHRPFRVRVRNEGSEWWPGGGEERLPPIRLAYRWLAPGGAVIDGEGHRTALPRPLGPGESCLVEMNVTAPSGGGRHLLEPDLVHEHVRWFRCGARPIEIELTAPDGAAR